MQATGSVTFDGANSDLVTSNLKKVEITLNTGDEPDKVNLTLADPMAMLPRPRAKAKIMVTIRDEKGSTGKFGPFICDQYSGGFVEDQGEELTITGTSVDFNSKAKTRTDATYKKKTLGEILQQESAKGGFGAHIDARFANIKLEHYSVGGRSPRQVITELAEEFDAIHRYEAQKLLFMARTGGLSAFGTSLSYALDRDDLKSWSWTRDFSADYKGVKASAQDHETGKRKVKKAELDEGDAFYEIRRLFPTEERAQRAATSKAKQIKRKKRQIEYQLKCGDVNLLPMAHITLTGLSSEANRTWVNKSVTHIFDWETGGFDTSAEAETLV